MPSFACPRCSTVVTVGAGQTPLCPKCGFGATAAAPQMAAPVAPAPWPTESAPAWNAQPGVAQTSPYYPQARTDGMSIAALVLGCSSFLGPFVGGICALLAIIFGIQGVGKCKRDPTLKGHGMAVAGIVLGSIFGALWLIMFLFIGVLFGRMGMY